MAKKYIDAQKLKEDIQANLAAISFNDDYQEGYEACGMSVLKSIESLQEEPDKDLEEEAEEWAENEAYGKSDAEFEMAYKGFIAGYNLCKEQMMKEAKDGYVSAIIIHNDGDEEHYAVTYPNGERSHSITDKVKIIIL